MAEDKLSLHLDTSYYIAETRRKQLLLTNTSSTTTISAVARDGDEDNDDDDDDDDGDGDGDDDVWELEARILSEECKLLRVEKELALLRRRSELPCPEPGDGFTPVKVEEVCFYF
jgi:molecular chaperone GrpE (heat shock protein)